MTYNPNLVPPVPNEDTYFLAATAVTRDLEAKGGIKQAIEQNTLNHNRVMNMNQYLAQFSKVAEVLDPIDRATGYQDAEHTKSKAFVTGGAAGDLLIRKVHPDGLVPVDKVFSRLFLRTVDIEDKLHSRHMLAEDVINQSHRGIDLLGSRALDVIGDWEDKLFKDIDAQMFFRRGIGLAALGAYSYHEFLLEEQTKAELAAFETQIEDLDENFDWDRLLRES